MPKLQIFLPCRISYRTTKENEAFLIAEGRRRAIAGKPSAVARVLLDDAARMEKHQRQLALAMRNLGLVHQKARRTVDNRTTGHRPDLPKRRNGATKPAKRKAKK